PRWAKTKPSGSYCLRQGVVEEIRLCANGGEKAGGRGSCRAEGGDFRGSCRAEGGDFRSFYAGSGSAGASPSHPFPTIRGEPEITARVRTRTDWKSVPLLHTSRECMFKGGIFSHCFACAGVRCAVRRREVPVVLARGVPG